jgi:hypothetical protein
MGRDPNEVDSTLTHPFLGVYTRSSLNRLAKAVEKNDPKRFRDKYRMVGARNFPASKELPEQVEPFVPDWEIRSGNKGQRREFVENLLVARLSTGDYSGLRSYKSYEFNPSGSIRELLNPWVGDQVGEKDIALLERFQSTHPMMKWSPHAKALNHTRNRIMSPLLPWENRLNLEFKKELLGQAKLHYLRGLIGVAKTFEKDLAANKISQKEARQKAVDSLEQLIFDFSKVARLDLDFERYLNPFPGRVPEIQLQGPVGPVDINNLALGIEYSFRMPFEMTPESREQAATQIQGFAESFAAKESGTPIQSANGDSHGHGLAVKFKVMDRDQASWRFEWDGIQRNYDADGKILNAWGGHIEVVTPKFSPQSVQGPISALFAQSRARGLQPRRSAGGAHINFDLTPLMKNEPAVQGTRRVINLISYFESTEPVILFLWQHPKRRHAAYPVSVSAESARRLYEFEGDWKQLGRLLYEIRYFNTYIGRKPKYVPLNLTSLMTSIVPDAYLEKTLDIRNGTQSWFPNFNKVYDRGEARLFDAPSDEAAAALQIKYFRALLNKGFNSEKRILLVQRFNAQDVENWKRDIKAWLKVAEEHLLELGLDPQEFRSVLWDSWQIQTTNEPSARTLTPYQEFLPAKN